MNRSVVNMILMLAVTLSANAQKASIEKRIAECAAIKGELERLECYDKIAKDFGLAATLKSKTIKGSGKWVVSSKTNPIDDSETITLLLQADEGKGMMGEPVSLIIRCKSGEIELFISWNRYLGSEAYVIYRVGSYEAQRDMWSLSSNSQASFYPNKPVLLIRSLLASDRFVAQVTPYSESPITAVFDIKGLGEAIKPLQKVCPF